MNRMWRMAACITVALGGLTCTRVAHGYGAAGHKMVGAIADARLAHDPAYAKVKELLDGLTLEEASVLPDSIKAWDRRGPDDPKAWHLEGHPALEAQLRAFWEANPTRGADMEHPSHHWFHYADIAVVPGGASDGEYGEGRKGASKWDIVHMIPYCVRVLRGEESDQNDRKITKAVALVLWADYVGDLHQPMHVGAAYFDEKGIVDPEKAEGFPTQGGNLIRLMLEDRPDDGGAPKEVHTNLHAYWDGNAVSTARREWHAQVLAANFEHHGRVTDDEIAEHLARHKPSGWKQGMDGPPTWAAKWATEILPLARQAHERLEFSEITVVRKDDDKEPTVKVVAVEKMPRRDRVEYADWAGGVVADEIHKAGWRLAELVRVCLR